MAIRGSIKTKNKVYVNRNKGPNPELQWHNYKLHHTKLNHLIRKTERKYFIGIYCWKTPQIWRSPCKSWKGLLINVNIDLLSRILKVMGLLSKTGNKYQTHLTSFVNVGSNLSKAIPKSQQDLLNFVQHTVYEWFCLMPVNDEEVAKNISSFKDSSAGWDEVKPSIIKNIKDCQRMSLTHICNLSFKWGIFHVQPKIANVVPIYKTWNKHVFSNYRPVSVLLVFPT